eukprot:CAMPEP_0167762350 /NCGR_PEP_ID=MMETSP0110_2-20121227/12715_1 /TAXON_ID=629695 /ORGANISM="Gymnochlora sp., Strain CCMP2014" /LENGTH=205 /DNA_ID=CAMNT_0007649207 /DNA_START=115 /DNA_END=733 /DNA_ORIENTATION=-
MVVLAARDTVAVLKQRSAKEFNLTLDSVKLVGLDKKIPVDSTIIHRLPAARKWIEAFLDQDLPDSATQPRASMPPPPKAPRVQVIGTACDTKSIDEKAAIVASRPEPVESKEEEEDWDKDELEAAIKLSMLAAEGKDAFQDSKEEVNVPTEGKISDEAKKKLKKSLGVESVMGDQMRAECSHLAFVEGQCSLSTFHVSTSGEEVV